MIDEVTIGDLYSNEDIFKSLKVSGAVVTASHFSKAAIIEAREEGKNPIALVDGFRLSKIVLDEQFPV